MPDYKKMYFKLFNAHIKVLEILKMAEIETEEIAMQEGEEAIAFCVSKKEKPDKLE